MNSMHSNQASLKMISVVNKCFWRLVLPTMLVGLVVQSEAATVDINAEYFPTRENPTHYMFLDRSVQSGYCEEQWQTCKSLSLVGFRLPISFRTRTAIQRLSPERQGVMFNVPSHWQKLNVVHEASGDTQELQVRVAGIGTLYDIKEDVRKLVGNNNIQTAHGLLWESGTWQRALPCQGYYYHMSHGSQDRGFWRVPLNAGTCAKRSNFLLDSRTTFEYLEIAFEYLPPKPLEMKSGIYTGNIKFPIGSGGIDVGDNMYPVNDNLIDVNFTLKVEHAMKVEVPPGGTKIELAPQGGWQSWLMAGRRPTRLFRDQTFSIWTTSKFKMHIQCDASTSYECAIKDPVSKQVVELKVSVTLPHGVTDTAGQPVNYRRLTGTQYFQPGSVINRAQGTLHFEIGREQMESMIKPNVASRYSGNVVVVWDSEV
jgi:hypothetical protein